MTMRLVLALCVLWPSLVAAQVVPSAGRPGPLSGLPWAQGGSHNPFTDIIFTDQALGPFSTCASPSYSASSDTDTGWGITNTPSLLNCIGGSAIVTTTASLVTSAVPVLAPAGSAAAPSVAVGSANKGLYQTGSGALGISLGGSQYYNIGQSSFALLSDSLALTLGASSDVSLSRGAANRLDLASGDSLYLVSGGLGVGVAETTAGRVAASRFWAGSGATTFFGSDTWAISGTTAMLYANGAYGISIGGSPASATTATKIVKKVTGIADNTATDVLTVTVPNANHAASIDMTFLCSTGSTDAFESSRTARGTVVLARTTGVATVAAVASLTLAQIATVGGGATLTVAYGVSAMSGAVGATQTFTVRVTVDDSGNLGSNQCVVLSELVNAEATGVTIS